MQLEHVALYVQNLEAMKEFYVRHFNATAGKKYHNPKTGFQSYFLSFDGRARLELMCRPGMTPHAIGKHPLGYAHISFKIGSQEKVDQKTEELVSAGFTLLNGPRTTGDGYYESVFKDPENNLVELAA